MAARRRVSSYDSTDDSQYFAPPENNLPAEDPGGGQDGGAPTYKPYEDGGITGKTPNPPTPPPPAFDPYQQVGHNGSINGMNREQWRDAWQSSGISNIADMKNWMT